MLSDEQIREIEETILILEDSNRILGRFPLTDAIKLLATVKELRKREDAQKELLRKCKGRVRHSGLCPALSDDGIYYYECRCDREKIENQIEEALKPESKTTNQPSKHQ